MYTSEPTQKPSRSIHAAVISLEERAKDLSLEQILRATLDEAEALTGSCIGFYHFVEEDQEHLLLQAWSTRTEGEFCKAEGKGMHFPVSKAGVWADCLRVGHPLIHNDYQSLPNRQGLPPGHAKVLRELVVPVKRSGRVVAVLGVGNKVSDYDESDVESVQLLADLAWHLAEGKLLTEALVRSETKFRTLYESNPDAVMIYDDHHFLDCNRAALDLYGCASGDEFCKLHPADLSPAIQPCGTDSRVLASEFIAAAIESGHQRFEWIHKRADTGAAFPAEVLLNVLELEGKRVLLGIVRDISDRKKAETKLRETKAILQAALDQSPAGIAIADAPSGNLRYVNNAGLFIRGGDPETIVNGVGINEYVASWQLLDLDGRPLRTDEVPLARAIMFGETNSREFIIQRANAEDHIVLANAAPIRNEQGDVTAGIVVFTDITESKRFEDERETTSRLVALASSHKPFHERMEDITRALQTWSGCEAVGIRLREGNDFPYYETRGFPPAFVQAENHLCAYDRNGKLLRDSMGNPVLECMCGNVLCGRFNPKLPFFTEQGSFWSNNTTALLASTGEADRRSRTRNHCNGEGYESVALIPMRIESETFGLLQFNDHRVGRFTQDLISRMERIGSLLAGTLARIQAQDTLLKNERRLKTIFSAMTEGFSVQQVICDEAGKPRDLCFVDANPSFELQTGLKNTETLGHTLLELFPQTEPYWIERYGKVGLTGESIQFEAEFGPLGKYYQVSAFQTEVGQFGTMFRDISASREATKAIQESHQRMQLATESAHLAVWDWDLKSGAMVWDDQMFKLYGRNREEIAGNVQDWKDGLHHEDLDRAVQECEAAIRGDAPFDTEFRVKHPDGTVLWVKANATVIRDMDGHPVRMTGLNRDITDIRSAEEEKKKLQKQLMQSQKLESLGTLAGGVAHDMNNVLGAILGLASAHIGTQPYGSPLHKALDTICKATERGGKVVKSLLGFARQSPVENRQLDMNEVIREQVELLERTILAKVNIKMHLDPELRPMRGDSSALSHAFMNLYVNAVDAMSENGTLTLHSRNVDEDWLEVVVEDNGMGMSKDVQEKALDPFFTTKGVGKGTGLGLSMAFSTVRAHLGQMNIQSELGKGTSVAVRFPTCENEAKPVELTRPDTSMISTGAKKVLLVDDDELILSSMQAIMEAIGNMVMSSAQSGEEALGMLEAGLEADLVILDMNMPGLGGAGTLPRLRNLRPDVPIVLSTGRTDQTAIALATAHTGVTILSKPFGIRELEKHFENIGINVRG